MFLTAKNGDTFNPLKNMILGNIIRLLMVTERKKFRIGAIEPQLMPAIGRGQVCVYLDSRKGFPIAYAIWAFVTDEVLDEMITNPNKLLHQSEWNEGLNLVIMDFVAPNGNMRPLINYLINTELRQWKSATALRYNANGNLKRVMRIKPTRREALSEDFPA